MKSIIIYYSHMGNTAYTADKLLEALSKRGEAKIVELEYTDGKRNILKRLAYRMFPRLVKMVPAITDLKEYDAIFIGVAVIGGYPPAVLSKYLSICTNIAGKKVVCFYVFGVEVSARKCVKVMRKILQKKKVATIIDIFVPWLCAHNDGFIEKATNEALLKLNSA